MAKKAAPLKDITELGARLKSVRLKHKMSRAEIGKLIGVTEASVRIWEAGKSEPPLAYLVTLAKNFGCDLNWLLLGEETTTPVDRPQSDLEKELLLEVRDLRKKLDDALSTPTALDTGTATFMSAEDD